MNRVLSSAARNVLPPVVFSSAKRVQARLGNRVPEWQYVGETWQQGNGALVHGWDADGTREAYRAQWARWLEALEGNGPLGVDFFRPFRADMRTGPMPRDLPWAHNGLMSYGYVLALTARLKERISIMDWGGGIAHFHPLSRALLPDVEIDYHCKDLPGIVEIGRELSPEVHFHSDDAEWTQRTYDLVFASSALQSAERWRDELRRLAAATSGHLFVTRLPTVSRNASFVMVQRAYAYGFDTEFLGWYVNRDEFLSLAAELGMELVREFVMMDETPTTGAPEQAVYRGFLFRPAGEAASADS